jgi:S-formylglutathione hydrolase FrmB
MHGRGGSDGTFVGDEAVYDGLATLGGKAPIVAFPDGGESGYWHDRPEGDWARYVMREAIPAVQRRFGTDPHRIAIGGISMGGFGAYDLARNDVVGTVEADPDAFGSMRVWNDYGDDPFRVYDEGFVAAMEQGDANFTTHSWPGGHDNGYWDAH